MQRNIFSPQLSHVSNDTLSTFFLRIAQIIFGGVMVLLPVWFVPESYLSLGLMKTMFVVVGVYGALLCAALALLRSGKIALHLPLPLIFFWLFALGTVLSAYLSGDVYDAVFGVTFEVFTAGFTVLLAVVMTLGLLFVNERVSMQRLLYALTAALVSVCVLTIARWFFDIPFLTSGVLSPATQTILGSLNDLAIYAGLVLVLTVVAIHRLPTGVWSRAVLVLVVLSALFILAAVNFSFLWIVLSLLSLVAFLFLIARDTWLRSEHEATVTVPRFSLGIVALICVVSGSFVVSGDILGQRINAVTGLNYIEVKPSFTATLEVAKEVYQENVFWGVGANHFADAWRVHKDPIIMGTQFWNTDFQSGNSYVTTVAITTGLLGMVFLAAFLIVLLRSAYQLFFFSRALSRDSEWYSVGLFATAATVYLWGVTFWYTPGQGMFLLTALFTGLTLAVLQSVQKVPVRTVNVAYSRQHGLLLVAAALCVIVGSTVLFINLQQTYTAQKDLARGYQAFAMTGDVIAYDAVLSTAADALPQQDLYPAERARLRLYELNQLITIAEPTEEERGRFEQLLLEAVALAEVAVSRDQTAAFNHALLGTLYGFVNAAEIEGVAEKRTDAFNKAAARDPLNPEYAIVQAQILSRYGDNAAARTKIDEALRIKPDYTDALFLLSQIDIEEGNAAAAIETTRAIIAIEPNNPARRFQLGLLLLAIGDVVGAQTAFSDTVTLDPSHANARYMRALTYLDTGRAADALAELKTIAETNQDNQALLDLITQVEAGDYTAPPVMSGLPVSAGSATSQNEGATLLEGTVENTSLVAPVNQSTFTENEEDATTSEQMSDPANEEVVLPVE